MKIAKNWSSFAKENFIKSQKSADKLNGELFEIYQEVIDETHTKINALYKKYETENGLNATQTRKYLSSNEFSVWRKSMSDYLKDIEGLGKNSDVALELNTLAMKSRISREEKILSELYRELYDMADVSQNKMYECLEDVLQVSYNRNTKNLLSDAKVKSGIYKLNKELVKEVLEYPWADKPFSKVVWDDIDDLAFKTRRILAQGFTSGASVQKMTSQLTKAMNTTRDKAFKLVSTECRFFANRGELLSYKDNGINKYVLKNGKSDNICSRCRFCNNVPTDIDKAVAYENFPPLHPHCKCYIAPVFEDGIFSEDDDYFEPRLIEKLKSTDDETVMSKLKFYENQIVDDIIENAIVITKDGEVYRCLGTANRVYPDKLGNKLIGASVTHNHPIEETEYSFSNDDIRLFETFKLKVLRGIDKKYLYELNLTGNIDIEYLDIFKMTFEDNRNQYTANIAEEKGLGYWRKKLE